MVIGVGVAEALFPLQSQIVGEQVELAGKNFEIIGVLEKRKSGFFGENEEDNAVFIPFETAAKMFPKRDYMMLVMRARTGMLRQAMDQVEEVLRRQPETVRTFLIQTSILHRLNGPLCDAVTGDRGGKAMLE